MDDQAFDADTILTCILAGEVDGVLVTEERKVNTGSLDATHPNACPFIDVCTGKDNCWVFTTELHSHRSEMLGSSHGHLYSNENNPAQAMTLLYSHDDRRVLSR